MKSSLKTLDCLQCASRESGIFCDLSALSTQRLNQKKRANHYKKGQVLFYEGNQPYGIYCIFSGKVKLYKNSVEGRPQILRLAGSGGILGYRSLFSEELYHATAEVLEEGEICFIDRQVFLDLVAENPDLATKLIKKLSQELRVAEELASSLSQHKAKERLAKLLINLKDYYGKANGQGVDIQLGLSREDLANMVGMTPETVVRLLSEFKEKGWIDLRGKKISVLKAKELAAVMD
ncbi:MAG: Crp/Fnr family transcriptional regulator [Deltaproteobacteria bacterium]|nr:Crp/Fnr family transcriptional regulator [Deltaproteobacteria bacterium]